MVDAGRQMDIQLGGRKYSNRFCEKNETKKETLFSYDDYGRITNKIKKMMLWNQNIFLNRATSC